MVKVQQVLEVERIVSLAKGFGWEKTGETVNDDTIVLTIEKRLSLRLFRSLNLNFLPSCFVAVRVPGCVFRGLSRPCPFFYSILNAPGAFFAPGHTQEERCPAVPT